MSLGPRGTFFSLSVLTTASLHFISSHCSCYSSYFLYLIYCSLHVIFFHPVGWSSSFHHMEGSHVISTIYPTDTDPGILSLRRSPHQIEFVIYWYLRACLFIFDPVFGVFFVCVQIMYSSFICCKKKKKKKKKNEKKNGKRNKNQVCIVIHHWVYVLIFEGHLIEYVCWRGFVCELPGIPQALYSFCCMFCERDEWLSLRSSGLLSVPSLCS